MTIYARVTSTGTDEIDGKIEGDLNTIQILENVH